MPLLTRVLGLDKGFTDTSEEIPGNKTTEIKCKCRAGEVDKQIPVDRNQETVSH
jgi:hypothetical protein